MKKFTRIISLLLVLCMVLTVMPAITIARAADADADLWVDPVNGSDTNDGTTEDTAFKTIDAAKTKAAELSANGDVVVILMGGTYDATETITFGAAESGKNGHTITYRAATGETALISGGEQIDGWTLHDAAHNIYVADIPKGTELTRQFYVNGEPQPMASMELTPKDLHVFDSYGYRSGIISGADYTHYLTVDLGEGKLVSSVTLYGDSEASATTGKAMGFPEDFTIQTSTDGHNWTTQVTETGFVAPDALGGVEFNFSSTAARYIKIEATKLGNPATNSQSGGIQHRLAFAEVQVGFTSKTNTVNLGIAQHVDLSSSIASASNVELTTNNPYVVTLGSSATAVGAVAMTAPATTVGTVDNIKVQVTADGTNWQTVYTKNGYTWKQSNTFAINPVAATKVRIISAQNITISELKVHKPAEFSGTVTATGTNTNKLMDGKFDGGFKSNAQVSTIYEGDITVNLGSVQDVGAVRLYPTYNGKVPTGYMNSARIQVSTDGVNYYTVAEMPSIQTPTGGAQLLVLPKGYKAQYVKIQPLVMSGNEDHSLHLDELDIVPSTITGILAENDKTTQVSKKIFTMIPATGATPRLGYYTDVNGSFIDYEVADGEAECIIDNARSYGYTSKFTYSELRQWGGNKVPSFLLELPAATEIGAIEVAIDPDLWSAPLYFDLQVYTNGAWKTVATENDPQWVDKTKPNAHYVERYEFDTVTATAARILVYNLTEEDGTYPESNIAANPAGYTTDFCLNEFTLYSVEEISYEEEENLDSETTIYDKVNLSNGNILGFGYYNGTALESFTSYNDGSGSKIFDGNYNTYGATHGQQYQWMPPYGPNVPALLLNTVKGGKPSTINAIELVVREDGFCAPYDFMLQVTTSADKDNWTTVAQVESKDWKVSNKALFKFPEMDVYKVRLVATLLTPMNDIPEDQWREAVTTYMHINELTLYNIYDPENPIAVDAVSQGEGTSGKINYDVRGAKASSDNSSTQYKALRAIDGFIEPLENAGLFANGDTKYYFSYLKNPENVEMHSLYLWYHRIQHFSSASLDGTELYTVDGLGAISGEIIMPTWLSNDYLFLDCPGEWYIDRNEGKIYYMAEEDMDGVEAILPVTDKIIDMEDVQNVTFEGITFSHTSWTYPSTNEYRDQQANGYLINGNWQQVPAGIDLTSCINVVFDGVQIRNMGTAGIRIKSDGDGISDGCKVLNSLVCDISYSGIVVGEIVAHHGYRDWQLVKNATIQNNLVTRIGIDMFDSVGIFVAYTNGAVIDHNEVAYTPYSGINLGWGWDEEEKNNSNALTQVGNNKVTNNFVHDVCRTVYDGGAIYTLGWQKGSVISGNYIYNSGSSATKSENAIYLDEGSAYIQVNGNVIDSTAQSWLQIYFSNIHDNTVTGNYYRSGLSTRGAFVNIGNSTRNNTSFSSVAGNAQAKAIADASGLTDNAFESSEKKGFVRQHNIGLEFWGSTDGARYTTDSPGWYNVHITGQVGRTYYNNIDNIVTIVMPEGTDLSSLTLQYSNYSNWSTSPTSSTTGDFTDPVTYTTTSREGTKTWTVKVVVEDADAIVPAPPVNDDPSVPTIPTQAPTEPPKPVEGFATGEYLQIIPESSLTPYVGDYVNGNFNTLVNQDPGEASYLTDVGIGTAGWIGSASASGTQAAVIELGGTKKIGGVELIARQADYLKTFEIQVKKTDGTWVTVQNVTSDPFNGCRSVMYTWTPVEGTAIRVLCYSWSSSRPMLQEIAVYEVKTGNILQEVVPNSVTSPQGALTPAAAVENVIDGFRGDSAADYFQTTGIPAQLTFDLTKDGAASNVKRMVIYAHATSKYAPAAIKLELEVNSAWTTVYDDFAYEGGDTDTFVLDLDQAYEATSARLTVNSTIAQELILTEVDFFGYVKQTVQEDIELPVPELTEVSKTDTSITVSVPAVTGGTAMYRIAGGAWQTSGTFTGLDRYTKYVIEAMYVGGNGYADSLTATLEIRTERTQLPAVSGFAVVEVTENSITVTGDTIEGGTLQFRINGGSWQTSTTFAELTPGTTYTIEARYNRKNTSYNATVAADYVSTTVTTESEPTPAVIGTSYSIRLIEPWALRTYITFVSDSLQPIGLANIKSYGAYAVIEHKFDGTTVEDLIADSDTKAYTSAAGTIAPHSADAANTVVFDFMDEIYTHRLDEKVYWVAYYEDMDGNIHYTNLKSTTIINVAQTVAGQNNAPAEEKAVLESMQVLKQAVVEFRGEDLGGTEYPAGVELNNSGINFNQNGAAGAYLFGTNHQIRLIEPWSIRVNVMMLDVAANALVDYNASNVNYGVIFFHDKSGAYADGMTIEDMITKGDALVYSKDNNNTWIAANGVNVVYDKGIYTHELNTNLYCLPYVVVDGVYYYRSSVICWNLLNEMETFSQNTSLSAEEIAVFNAMVDLHEKTMAYRGK